MKSTISAPCGRCGSTGLEMVGVKQPDGSMLETEIECRKCEGTGKIPIASLDADFCTDLADIKDKVDDIKEKVDEIKAVVDAL